MSDTTVRLAPVGGPREILVTGGCGYIGSHAVRVLCRNGYSVVILDNMSKGHLESVAQQCDFKLYQCDLEDRDGVDACFKQHHFVGVLHFAGKAEVGESMRNPEIYYDTNLLGGMNLLNACIKHRVSNFVFSSTCATYGDPQRLPLDESHPQLPINPYGRSKLAFEHALLSYAGAYDFRYLAFRYFNAAGADPEGDMGEDHDPESHLIPIALFTAQGKREQLSIFGRDYDTPDGTCQRDYIHVCDLADAHLMGLEYLMAGGESAAMNLGTGRAWSVLDVARACEEVTGKTLKLVDAPRREGDPPMLVADPARAKNVLGFEPKRSDLKTIVEDAWRWHQKHPNGYGAKGG